MAPAPLPGLEWAREVFVVPCIRLASIPRVRQVHAQECQGVPVSELPVQEWAQRLAWRLRLVLPIAHRADMRSGVVETIATRSRRKVQ
jgi:hypothetical protein